MSILILDTETNGFPPDCRIIQLAWQIYSLEEVLLCEDSSLVLPDGWVIPEKQFWIDNGYSTEKNRLEGMKMKNLLEYLCLQINQLDVDTIVCHNIAFDGPVLAKEMQTYEIKTGKKLKQICTMKSSTNFCAIPNQWGQNKWPNLTELHNKLFSCGFEGAHDALSDVKACAKCFFELLRREIIKL